MRNGEETGKRSRKRGVCYREGESSNTCGKDWRDMQHQIRAHRTPRESPILQGGDNPKRAGIINPPRNPSGSDREKSRGTRPKARRQGMGGKVFKVEGTKRKSVYHSPKARPRGYKKARLQTYLPLGGAEGGKQSCGE